MTTPNLYVVSELWKQFRSHSDACNVVSFPAPCGNTNTSEPPFDANTVQRLLLVPRQIYNGNFITTVADWDPFFPETVTYGSGASEVTVTVTSEDKRRLATINLGELEPALAMYREPFKSYDLQTRALEEAISRLRTFIEKL